MRLSLPYDSFEQIQFNNDETFNFAYFNSHIRKLFANLDSYKDVQKLPIASADNYGLVQVASVDDITNGTHPESVLSLNNFQEFLRSGIDSQRKTYTTDGSLKLNKDISVLTGTINVPTGFYVGKTVTQRPSRVLFAHVSLEVPGMAYGDTAHSLDDVTDTDGRHYTCCATTETDSYKGSDYVDLGKIRYKRDTAEIPNVKHIQAYYKDGVVVVRNEAFDENKSAGTSSIRVRWTLIQRN